MALAEPEILEGEAQLVIVEAASMKIQRVVRCSMSAEVSMAATAFEHGDFIRAALSEIIHGKFVLKDWKLWANRWRHFLVIDAKTGFDVLTSESQTSDRKVQIDLAVLKQALTMGSRPPHDLRRPHEVVWEQEAPEGFDRRAMVLKGHR